MYSKKEEQKIFLEAVNGYGFVEVPQTVDGVYCTGCMRVHKRPTKMYTNRSEVLCKYQVAMLYNPNLS